MNAKCLNPKCQREAMTRGLYAACYVRATEVVRERLTTWKKLEAAKKILPSHCKKHPPESGCWGVPDKTFPPGLPTHAGARASFAAKRSPSIHLGHPRLPWPVPPICAGINRLADVIRLVFVMVGRPFGHYSLVLVLPYLFPFALVIILWRKMQVFLWRRFNPASIKIATNPSR
jgi:hypothetical protein